MFCYQNTVKVYIIEIYFNFFSKNMGYCAHSIKKYVFRNGKELAEEQILNQFLQYKKLYKLEYDKTCNFEFHPLTTQYFFKLKIFDR